VGTEHGVAVGNSVILTTRNGGRNDDDSDPNADSNEKDVAQSDDGATNASNSAKAAVLVEVVADKGYHKAELLLDLKESSYRTYIPERDNSARKWTDKSWEMQQVRNQ